jgi:indolepyruvate ferredoxin oxidoreductase alpha subunit
MTGFQPHPGVAKDAMDRLTPIIKLEDVCRGIGLQVEISDPFEIKKTTKTIYEMLQLEGTRVIILRRACGIAEAKRKRVYVDQTKCIGEECGCVRFCSRVFNCPGIMWDERAGKARIDEVVCNGCGACAQLCPRDAIVVDE